jgi:hypothetical protein
MSLVIKEQTFKPVPAGQHSAICINVVDLGVQDGKFGPKEQLWIRWELPELPLTWRDKQGKPHTGPMTISKTYTHSRDPKSNLYRDLTGWFAGQRISWDTASLLGKACTLLVNQTQTLEGVVRSNITAIMPPANGAAPAPGSPLLSYDVDNPDSDTLALLPSWVQEKINGRVKGMPKPEPVQAAPVKKEEEVFDDKIPF